MIVLGSYAALLNGIKPSRQPKDIDLFGTAAEHGVAHAGDFQDGHVCNMAGAAHGVKGLAALAGAPILVFGAEARRLALRLVKRSLTAGALTLQDGCAIHSALPRLSGLAVIKGMCLCKFMFGITMLIRPSGR